MTNRSPLLPSPQLLSSPMLPTIKYDYFHHSQDEPVKKLQYAANEKKRPWEGSSGINTPGLSLLLTIIRRYV
jgi:hypothetical protein